MPQKVLVADDSEPVQKAIQIAMEPYDVEIFEASSFVEALNICKKKSPDIIIADASLTGTGDPKEFKMMSNTAGEAPVLLLEGSFEPIDKEEFEAVGMDVFLKKPFNIEDVERTLVGQMNVTLSSKRPSSKPDGSLPTWSEGNADAASMWDSNLAEQDLQLDINLDSDTEGSLDQSLRAPIQRSDFLSGSSDLSLDLGLTGDDYDTPAANGQVDESVADSLHSAGVDWGLNSALLESLVPTVHKALLPLIKKEIEDQVQKSVMHYCEQNFKRLAREVIREELRSLVSE